MHGYKEPGFQERTAAANRAKSQALNVLRARPRIEAAEQARRKAAQLAKEAAVAEKRAAALQAKEQAKALRDAREREAAEAAAAALPKVLTEAERKAARDARYAARKGRQA